MRTPKSSFFVKTEMKSHRVVVGSSGEYITEPQLALFPIGQVVRVNCNDTPVYGHVKGFVIISDDVYGLRVSVDMCEHTYKFEDVNLI